MAHSFKVHQFKEEAERKIAEEEIAAWIKTDILAEIVFEELESAGLEASVENARIVYLELLDGPIYDAIKTIMKYHPAFAGKGSGLDPVGEEENVS